MSRVDGQSAWRAAGFYHLRTPLLPIDELVAFWAGLEAPGAMQEGNDALPAAAERDRARLRERLRDWVARPEVRESLHVASPDLVAATERWTSGDAGDAGLEASLYQYLARMTGRATPFGLFAGCSVGTIGTTHRLALADRGEYRRLVGVDSGRFASIAAAVARTFGDQLVVHPNAGLYEAAGRVRYLVGVQGHAAPRARSDAVIPDAFLRAALDRAQGGGGASIGEVARAVAAAGDGVSPAEARDYVHDLVARRLLVGELDPVVTGQPPLDDLMARLRTLGGSDATGARLAAARASLCALEQAPLGADIACYRAVDRALDPLVIVEPEAEAAPPAPPLARAHDPALQVDLAKPLAAGVLGEAVTESLHRGTLVLQRLFRERGSRELADFRHRFADRYEEREVPLLEALDEDCGIGYAPTTRPDADPSPLLAGLAFPARDEEPDAPSAAARWLLPRVAEVLRTGADALHVEPDDLAQWEREARLPPPDPLPDAYAVMAVVAAEDDAAVAAGRFRVLHGGAGSHAAALLGRFCQRDEALHARLIECLRAEESLRPDAVFAEIVYCPEPHLGNVVNRPVLRAYEIPVLGRSGAPADRQLLPADLRVSVVGGRVRLRSARLGREVLPRLASALDVRRPSAPGLVRFLAALQAQDGAGVAWSWEGLRALPVLPRVVTGNVVLQRALWRIDARDGERLRAARGVARIRAVHALRERLGLPRHVGVRTGDAILPLDLENVLALDVLAKLTPAGAGATLVELFPSLDEHPVRGPEGRYAHELVIPFLRAASPDARVPQAPAPRASASTPVAPAARSIPPGGEWCYARLYGGRASADRLLLDEVVPLAQRAMTSGACDRWFFIRYADPHDHLRVRLHGDPARLARDVVPALHEASRRWLAEGLTWKVQLDTYEREVERLGGLRGLELSEQLFAADTEAVVAMLAASRTPRDRWQGALLGIHHLLLDLGLGQAERQQLLRDAEAALGREFGVDAAFRARIGRRYREERAALEELLAMPVPPALAERSRRLAPIVAGLREEQARGRLAVPIPSLARHYVHLHVNRALRSSWRAQELVLVALLARLGEAARARGARGARDDLVP